ncbi:vomeronasal type-2 receptor 116-like [Fukomys damarensis]|uniref:vomeronasal type-2 receptor 116-like n=1 Tax=Fukomys damarensis TaxID=885580 RepID=UPI00053FB9C4|nr:vomeronasal type-2 receptor 116-like [Fukomys damarensis]
MQQCLKCPGHQYSNIQRNRCLQKSVTFLAFEDPLGKTLVGTALSLAILTAVVLGLFVKHRDTPMVKANNRTLSYTLLISLIFCFLCSLLFIGLPNTATCILQQTTFGIVFTVAVSTILAKTITSVGPLPRCVPQHQGQGYGGHGGLLHLGLGYLGSLALVSFTLAFLARNLPDTFNEAKFLTFSMLLFCRVWVPFLAVYHSTKGKVMVAMEVFSILASSAGLLACIFIPKCYIILLRPDRNSLHGFRDKTHSDRKKIF